MKNVIIGIHGLGNKPPKNILYSWWYQSIIEGCKKHNKEIGEFEFELVYWADILHPVPYNPANPDPDSPFYLEDPYVPSMNNKHVSNHTLKKKISNYVEKKISQILLNEDFTLNYQAVTDGLIKKYFHDLEMYYNNEFTGDKDKPLTRDKIRGRLVDTLKKHKNDRVLLIGHSMGSIIAFDVLDIHEELKVDTFITIGSPLGLPVVIGRMAQERNHKHDDNRILKIPDTIKEAWYNLADLEDNVAFDFKLSDDYKTNSLGVKPVDMQVLNDYEYRRRANPHKVYGYLRTPEMAEILAKFNQVKTDKWYTPLIEFFTKKEVSEKSAYTEKLDLNIPAYDNISKYESRQMDRGSMLSDIRDKDQVWDFIVVGGGATGMGVAVDAASRGYKTLLLEQSDFAKATSSRSTKLIHGGVRYLQQGNISLVLEALQERSILRRNAPHLVHDLPFVVPNYDWWEGPFYGIGLRVYDMLAGRHGFGASINLSPEETIKRIPQIEDDNLRGGVLYHDGQFDDSRLIINLAQTAAEEGATLLNYVKVTSVTKENDIVNGVIAEDIFTSEKFELKAKTVVNATGIFTDDIRKMDDSNSKPVMKCSRGVHIVLDRSFLGGDTAIMVPHTSDGRVMFAIPWNDKVVIGTTDTAVEYPELEPAATKEDIDFILENAARYLEKDPTYDDIKSVFAGLRPLVAEKPEESTASISREHQILISPSGLVTITGGKWTTYRLMAKETIDKALTIADLPKVDSPTKNLAIHGWIKNSPVFGKMAYYGVDAYKIEELISNEPALEKTLHPDLPITKAMVVWAVRSEMACTVEDVLSRRTRCLLLDARASVAISEEVAKIMALELKKDKNWIKQQVIEYGEIAQKYIPPKLSI